jgi:amino acid adenylation domain-containing protein
MQDRANLSEAKLDLLKKYLQGEILDSPADRFRITPRESGNIAPLSAAQHQVWLHHHIVPDDVPVYNETLTIHRSGPLNEAALARTFAEIIRRHEIWRTTFDVVEGQPVQIIHPAEPSFRLTLVNLDHLPEAGRSREALRLASEEAVKPFDLRSGPLLRAMLVRLAEDQHRLFMTFHQLIFDGVTAYQVFLPELARIYEAFSQGRPSPLSEPRIQYADFAISQQTWLKGPSIASQMTYWQTKLAGELPVLNWPVDRSRRSMQTYRGEMQRVALPGEVLRKLRVLCETEGASLFMALVAGLSALLYRYTGQEDIILGAPTAGRKLPELQGILGYFLNVLPLRIDLAGNPTFRELLKRVRGTVLEALSNEDAPFAQLIERLRPTLDPSRNPLFQIALSLEPPPTIVGSGWSATQSEIPTGASKLDLYIDVEEKPDGIVGPVTYNPDVFEPGAISRMIEHWRTLLESASAAPERRLADLPILTPDEQRCILLEWNETQDDTYSRSESIQQHFVAQCERTPDAVAVRDRDQELTFWQLHERSNSLAQYLQNLGAGPGTAVALCVERSVDMVAGLLAILKTGAAYVPLDPSYPSHRLGFMLQDSEAKILILQRRFAGRLPAHSAREVCLDPGWNEIVGRQAGTSPFQSSRGQLDDTAYVLYTSGSTGTPKGVQGTQRACLNRFAWMWRAYPFQAGEVCCQKTNLGFVDSVWEIFGPLLAGVPTLIIAQDTLHDPEELLQTLAREQVTRMVLVPSLLRMLLEHAPQLGERVPRLKLWSCSGEVLPVELVERFRAGFPAATLLNLYGSAEVAADVTWHQVRDEDLRANSIPIGKPIANTQVYILDGNRNPVPMGVRGEIYVGGDGLAQGYWRRPELTAERFVANPVAVERSPRLYRTGDLGRFKAAGEIEYLGRVDSQVKLRGMRLELGEIEAVLGTHPGVREAVVGLTADQQRLAAYVTVEDGTAPAAGELRRYLRARLPEHMVPASYSRLEEWPLLPSGKVDRKAVLAAAAVPLSDYDGLTAPRTEVEQKLAAVWQELLKLEQVGVDQNFFELGGHSLLALQVMARIRSLFEVELPVRSLFEEPTLAALAAEVEKAQALGLKARTPILQRRARPAAASPSPEALLAQLDNLSAADLQSLIQRVLRKPPA